MPPQDSVNVGIEKALKDQLGHLVFTLTALTVQLGEVTKERDALKSALDALKLPTPATKDT